MPDLLRRSVLACLLAVVVAAPSFAEDFAAPTGEVLLTVTGKITAKNAGEALQLDRAQLDALPQTSFTTSTTWTSGTPTFTGVLLKDLVAAVGATGTTITLTAANDYAITLSMADVADDAPLLAVLMDGQPMSLRDKGPIWLVYPYDTDEKFRTELTYSRSIWQLTSVDFGE
jgi:hypothetical protein